MSIADRLMDQPIARSLTNVVDEESTVFHLQLNCTSRKSLENETLSLSSFPSSALELKKAIEDKFSIPVCVQSLSYQLVSLTDSDNLVEKRLRSGDTLSVSYLCEGECQLLREITEWFLQVAEALQAEQATGEGGHQTDVIVNSGIRSNYRVLLARCFVWLNTKGYVNKLYFESIGGIEAVIELYGKVSSLEWDIQMRPALKFLECFLVTVVADFGEMLELRRRILKHDGVFDMVLRSLLRVKMVKGEQLEDSGHSEAIREYNGKILRELLRLTAHAVCNFADVPECQLKIASTPHVLDQLICIALSNQFIHFIGLVVAETFLLLANDADAHTYLIQPDIVGALLQLYRVRTDVDVTLLSEEERASVTTLRYTILVEFAQLVLVSRCHVPSQFVSTIRAHMDQFLSEIQPSVIAKYEEDQMNAWSTLLPYVELFYSPYHHYRISDEPSLVELRRASVKMILFFLHSKFCRNYICEILVKEGLLDYVIALPWNVEPEFEGLAKALVSELGNHVKLQTPSLCSIAKAKLAKMHFGLKKIIVKSCSPVDLIRSVQAGPPIL